MSYCIEVPMGMITVCFHRLVVESRGRCSETLDTNMPFMCDSHSTDRWRLGVIGQFASKRKSFSVLVCKESENSRKWREHQRERNLVWWPVKIESPPSSGAGRPGWLSPGSLPPGCSVLPLLLHSGLAGRLPNGSPQPSLLTRWYLL